MTRPLRIELAGGLYHVTSRGDRREDIYFDDGDRLYWLGLFGDVCRRFNWVCHAYCQMSNHWHVVIETPEGNLSEGMRQLNGVYTQYINRRYQRVGHVYQGRYKAILVEKDSYLVELARYVVLNPVRAGMVRHAGEWAWSSYLATVGMAPIAEWLETGWILGQFSDARSRARLAYVDFVAQGVGQPSIWQQLRGQIFLGGEAFLNELKGKATDGADALREVSRAQRRMLAQPLSHFLDRYPSRREGMAQAYATGHYTMKSIAEAFGVHYSTVSLAVKWHESRLHGN